MKTRKSDDEVKAMVAFAAMFTSLEDAMAFEKAALAAPNPHLPPCARVVRDDGQRTTLYWRWLHVLSEVWS
jgi:hypothetical protein